MMQNQKKMYYPDEYWSGELKLKVNAIFGFHFVVFFSRFFLAQCLLHVTS